MTRGSWLALVLTVKGLTVLAPDDPNVVVHVLGGLGTVATNPTQLAVAETPALTVTVSLVAPVPPVQNMVKSHKPAETVCSGRLLSSKTVVTPPALDWTLHGVARDPISWSIVGTVQPGAMPAPCMYNWLPAAHTTDRLQGPPTRAHEPASSD